MLEIIQILILIKIQIIKIFLLKLKKQEENLKNFWEINNSAVIVNHLKILNKKC